MVVLSPSAAGRVNMACTGEARCGAVLAVQHSAVSAHIQLTQLLCHAGSWHWGHQAATHLEVSRLYAGVGEDHCFVDLGVTDASVLALQSKPSLCVQESVQHYAQHEVWR